MNCIIYDDIKDICNESLPWEELDNKSILVTGANGYLASYIIYALLHRNEFYSASIKIIALCRSEGKAKRRFSEFLEREDFKLLIQDVMDEIDDKYRADIIIHAASPASPYVWNQRPYDIVTANLIGFNNVIECAKKWKSDKVILYSSGSVYGLETPKDGADENYRDIVDFEDIDSCYRLSKQMSEMMAQAAIKQYRIDVRVVRPFIIYGPGMGYSQHKHITDFLKNYIMDENITLKSNGIPIRSFCYIKDATVALLYVLFKGRCGEAYNISSENGICSVKELAQIFAELSDGLELEFINANEEYLNTKVMVFTGDIRKLKQLGFKESIALKEGISKTIEWAKESDFLEM